MANNTRIPIWIEKTNKAKENEVKMSINYIMADSMSRKREYDFLEVIQFCLLWHGKDGKMAGRRTTLNFESSCGNFLFDSWQGDYLHSLPLRGLTPRRASHPRRCALRATRSITHLHENPCYTRDWHHSSGMLLQQRNCYTFFFFF